MSGLKGTALIPGGDSRGLCSPLAPFDNNHILVLNVAVGGGWGNNEVDPAAYQAFHEPRSMLIKEARLFKLA